MSTISDNINELILEWFAKKHAVIQDMPDRKTTLTTIAQSHKINKPGKKGYVKSTTTNLKTMSPKGLFHSKGLNVTKYQKIMNKYSVGNPTPSKHKYSGI
jgi:hypothetical protein